MHSSEGIFNGVDAGYDAVLLAENEEVVITVDSNGSEQDVDKVGYDPHPPEGVVLVRSGDKLVPSGASAYAYSR